MKKQIFILCAAALSFKNAQAQSAENFSSNPTDLKKIRFGVAISPNLSWMRPSAAKDGNQTQASGGNKFGFSYGIMADYNFTENYTIATGLNVNSTGGIMTTENLMATVGQVSKSNVNYSLQFLEIPVALKLRTDRIGKFSFFGQAGVTMAINISKKATYEVTQKTAGLDSVKKVDAKEKITGGVGNITPIMFQMNVGLGAQYAIGPKLDAYVGFFFNNGFAPNATDPTKIENFASFTDGNTRLNNFSLRLGFYF